jgi:arginyl-tRNA--protein-N-Asp/Glu arginylyltransferase
MIIFHRFIQGASACAYLPDQRSRLEYELAASLSPEEYEHRMNSGWRKFGMLLFHPVCASCQACRPIRILAERFCPDRSQARAAKRNADLRVEFAPPAVDETRLALYRRYHEAQASRKGWEAEAIDANDYAFRFLRNSLPAVEISVWNGNELCAIALTEVTPNSVSGIYHYHDPLRLDRSLGTYVMLQTLELAKQLARPYAYFGYYVSGCGSLEYKARFRPCEILGADGQWHEVTGKAGA